MKSDEDYKKLESRYENLEKFYTFYKYFAMFLFFVFALPTIFDKIGKLAGDEKIPVVSQVTLATGIAGNLDIKAITYDKSGEETTIKEKVIKNAQWAKLELWPTIGCAKPTLVYLDGDNHINRMLVDEAKIIQ